MKNPWLADKIEERQNGTRSPEVPDAFMGLDIDGFRDYIVLMLGAPVVKVELDESQVNLAICEAVKRVDAWGLSDELDEDGAYEMVIKDGALAYAKHMLGIIRRKYNIEDGYALVKEGHRDIRNWEYWLDHLATEYYNEENNEENELTDEEDS